MRQEIMDRLDEIEATPAEDVFPGATFPTVTAFRDARKFVNKTPDSFPVPFTDYANDGEINLWWESEGGNVHIDVGFVGDGEYSYYAHVKDAGIDTYGDNVPAGKGPNDDILAALKAMP